MHIFKQITEVTSRQIVIQLPEGFDAKQVEITVKSCKPDKKNIDEKIRKAKLKELLLNGPTLTEEELSVFEENRKWMNKWKIKKF